MRMIRRFFIIHGSYRQIFKLEIGSLELEVGSWELLDNLQLDDSLQSIVGNWQLLFPNRGNAPCEGSAQHRCSFQSLAGARDDNS